MNVQLTHSNTLRCMQAVRDLRVRRELRALIDRPERLEPEERETVLGLLQLQNHLPPEQRGLLAEPDIAELLGRLALSTPPEQKGTP